MNNLTKSCFSLAFLLCTIFVNAQNKDTTAKWQPINLVTNFSFEAPLDSTKSIKLYDDLEKLAGWTAPNKSKPLVYSTDAKGNIHDPNGSSWAFKARSGKNVGGIDVVGTKRDYIQGTLSKPLTVGKKYYFAFWVHYHCSGANNIGIAFLPSKVALDSNLRIPLKPATYQRNLVPYSNDAKSTWVLVRDSFIAQMPFQSFVIGNFFTDEETQLEKGRFNHFFAYIDDVAVWEAKVQPSVDITTKEQKDDWQRNVAIVTPKNVPITLEDVFFGFNSSDLESLSFIVLDSLVKKMQYVPSMKIHIIGHTSSEGSYDFNLKLSSKRAEAVKNYIASKGIDISRLSSEGMGEKMPIASNDSEEGRKTNRRVEFIRVE